MARVLALVGLVVVLVGMGTAVAEEPAERLLPFALKSATSDTASVVVVAGDHLWKISARHLEGRPEPVTPYWLEVIEVNTPNLRSGNPDLIFPGEVIDLPAP